MKILFIGDISGRTGRNAIKEILPKLKSQLKPDFVFANGENVTSGLGIKIEHYEELIAAGIDYFTSGNHIWDKKEIIPFLDDKNVKILRPANYPQNVPGRGFVELEKLVLVSLSGRVFVNDLVDCPFRKFNEIYEQVKNSRKPIVVDFHAETTSEKRAFGFYVDGRAAAVIGTHTHVPTADAQILPEGTAYISDVGMVGAEDSVLGVEKKNVIEAFLTALPWKVEPAKSAPIFNAVLIEIDKNNKARRIELIQKEV